MPSAQTPDFIEAGQGHRVILLHSSVAGARQWRSLMEQLSDRFNLIAINLMGYGDTPGWTLDRPQALADQAALVDPFLPQDGAAVSIVGHSFGASVAMKAAARLGARVRALVLIEPNPFDLLRQHGRIESYRTALALRDVIKAAGKTGSWDQAGEVFARYWTGPGSWEAMPGDRRQKFAQALRPNFHEWDAVLDEVGSLTDWQDRLPRDTTVISAADTVPSIRDICALMKEHVPAWRHEVIARGGHMAVLGAPELVIPIVARALEQGRD